MRGILSGVSAIAMLASSGVAFAQPAAAEGVSGAESIGEIVVTARKRAERLLDVPVAVTALSQERLERYATSSLAAVATQTPQLVIGESQGQTGGTINLRGVGGTSSNASADQFVSINVDGIQVSQGNILRLGQFDLQRVEVLKGPQALFFGKNSPGGIISLVSADPGANFETKFRGGYEFTTRQRFMEAVVSGPLGGGFGARLVGYIADQDGWYRNTAVAIPGLSRGPSTPHGPEQQEYFARGTLTYQSPDNSFNAKLKVNWGKVNRDRNGISDGNQMYYCPFGAPQLSLGLTTDCKLDRNYQNATLTQALAAVNPAYGDGTPYFRSQQEMASLSMDYDLSDTLKLSSVTGYYHIRQNVFDVFSNTSAPFIAANFDVKVKQYTQELRLASDFDGPLNFLVGGFYQDGDFAISNPLFINIPGVVTITQRPVYFVDTKAYSFFGQLRYKVTGQFELSAGGRYSHETKNLSGTYNETPFTVLFPKKKYHDFSPEFTATYKPAHDLTIYASYREGFTSGGYNTTPQALNSPASPGVPVNDPSYQQTTVRGGEAGFKGYLFDRQLLFDLTGYYYEFKDLQLSAFNPTTAAQTTRNAGASKVRGIELNATVRPREAAGLELRSGIAYNNATYSEFFAGCWGGQTVAQGCRFNPTNPNAAPATFGTAANPYNSQDLAGRQLVRAPKWMLNGGMTYEREIGSGLKTSLSIDGRYSSGYYPDVEDRIDTRQKGFVMIDANLTLGRANGLWDLALIGRNLTKTFRINSGGGGVLTGSGTGTAAGRPADAFGSPYAPRSVALQLTVRPGR